MPTAVLLGDINVDLLLTVPAYPPEGGEAIAGGQVQQLGGSATNTAICLARLGIGARMIGRVGADAFGDSALTDMARAGVDTGCITRDPEEPTQLNLVVVSRSGERTMFAYRGANARLSPEQITAEALAGAGLVHLSGYSLLQSPQRDAALKLIALAEAQGLPVTLDIPAGIAGEIGALVRAEAGRFDTILLGDADIGALGLADAGDLLKAGVRLVVVKRGANGCTMVTEGGARAVPGIAVSAIDTTGAGDALAAGIIAGRLAGLSEHATGVLGTGLGAVAVTRIGAGLAMPSRADLDALLAASPVSRDIIGEIAQRLRATPV